MTSLSYQQAGVSIDAGNALVDRIKPAAAKTKRTGSMSGLGGFGALFDLKACGYHDPILVSSNDGVGTKLHLAFACDSHLTIGIDLVAMCVNDLLAQGAEPMFFLDYFATSKLDVARASQVIEGIANGCLEANTALIGGETAEMPGLYASGHYDLAGFVVGAVERENLLPSKNIAAGDVAIAIASSGVHSNGFSLVRKIIEVNNFSLTDAAPFAAAKTLGEALLTPTRIYVKSLLPLIKTGQIKGLAHITGGGLVENPPRIFPENLALHLDLGKSTIPAVFSWLQKSGNIETREMLRTFNCGIGMLIFVAEAEAENTLACLQNCGEKAWIAGNLRGRENSDSVLFYNEKEFFNVA
jgi:phosphoribosylformylglycinamidine cyclo-ligase